METGSHDSIGSIERFLDSIAMVHIDIDVEYARMYPIAVTFCTPDIRRHGNLPEKLQDTQYDIVDIAESTRFRLLGVMQSSRPVDGDVGLASVQPLSGTCRCQHT
jgi:hypothetical protein